LESTPPILAAFDIQLVRSIKPKIPILGAIVFAVLKLGLVHGNLEQTQQKIYSMQLRTSAVGGMLEAQGDTGEIIQTKRTYRNVKEEMEAMYNEGDTKTKVNLICNHPDLNWFSKAWQAILTFLIVISVVVHCTATLNKPVQWDNNLTDEEYEVVEVFLTIIFILELLVRMYVSKYPCCRGKAKLAPKESEEEDDIMVSREPLISEAPFLTEFYNIVDLIAVSPYILEKLLGGFTNVKEDKSAFLAMSVIRLLRLLRIFKIFRQLAGAKILYKTMISSLAPLTLTFLILFLFFTFIASFIFMFEPCLTEDCTFKDVFNTGYFVIITLTTVGFGDQIPSNKVARFMAVVTMLFGAVFLSMPIAVIGNQFERAYNDYEKKKAYEDPVKRDKLLKQQHEQNTRNRKQRIMNSMIGLQCFVHRLHDHQKNIDDSHQFASIAEDEDEDANIYREESMIKAQANSSPASKYAVSQPGIVKHSSSERKQYRVSLLHKVAEFHALFVKDARELFDFSQFIDSNNPGDGAPGNSRANAILRSHTLKTEEFLPRKSFIRSMTITERMTEGFGAAVALVAQDGREIHVKSHYEKLIGGNARLSTSDKVWMALEVPESGKAAACNNYVRWTVMFLAIIGSFLQTMPQVNHYGEDTYLCRKVVNTFCKRVEASGNAEYIAQNPACFAEGDYAGCVDSIDKCAFPSVSLNFSCSFKQNYDTYSTLVSTVDTAFVELGAMEGVPSNGKCPLASYNVELPFSNIKTLLPNSVPICNRNVCKDNAFPDMNTFFAAFELAIVIYLCVEFLIRLSVSRHSATFLKHNVIDTIAMLVTTLEYILVVSDMGGFRYNVWGMPYIQDFEPVVFRPLRLWVPFRFLLMARHFRGVDVCNLTVKKVSARMATPMLFFIVCIVLFAGILYVAELQPAIVEEGGVCVTSLGEDTKCFVCNGEKCHVQDMFDAMWIIIVTMTSVGYGGLFPKTAIGKSVIMSAAIFGAFYLAMPLTIVGTQFYSIYLEKQHTTALKSALGKVNKSMFAIRSKKNAKDLHYALRVFESERKLMAIVETHPKDANHADLEILKNFCLISPIDICHMQPKEVDDHINAINVAVGIVSKHLNPKEHGLHDDGEEKQQ
jgi:hypothetical protein